jgi:hypothetical protein
MTALDELMETANRLSKRLEQAANEEKKFSVEVQLMLERMSWEVYRNANELNEIKQYIA